MGFLLGLLMVFQPLAADNFQRANASFTSPWVVQTTYAANFIVSSNTATVSTFGSDSAYNYQGITWPADQWAAAQLLSPGTTGGTAGFGVTVRASTSAQTFYRFICNANSSRVSKTVAGTATTLSANPVAGCVSGDIVMLGIRGTQLTAYVNYVSVFTVSDSAIASGNAGIFYFSTSSGGAISQWWGGGYR